MPRPKTVELASPSVVTILAPPQQGSHLVDVALVDEDPKNARLTFDKAKLASLAEAIKSQGQLVPCIVRRLGERYLLVDGARRYRATKLAGLKQLRVEVLDIDGGTAAVAAAVANLQREDLTPYEQARALQAAIAAGLTKKDACAKAGLVFNTLQARLALLELPQRLGQLAGRGAFSLAHAQLLTPLQGHAVTSHKASVALLDVVAEYVDARIEKPDFPGLWDFPSAIAQELSSRKLVRTESTTGKLGYRYDFDQQFAKIRHVVLGDGKRSCRKKLYVDVAAFDARVAHLVGLEQKREAAAQRRLKATRQNNEPAGEPSWKRQERKRKLQSHAWRRLVETGVVSTLKSKQDGVSSGLWGILVAEVHHVDCNWFSAGDADRAMDCAKLAAATSGADVDQVAATFALTGAGTGHHMRRDARALGDPPAWWLKLSRDGQGTFAVAFLATLRLEQGSHKGALLLLTGHGAEDLERKADKMAEKVLDGGEHPAKDAVKRGGA